MSLRTRRTFTIAANAWYVRLREKELSWIRDGKNPEEEFDKLYEPEVSGNGWDPVTFFGLASTRGRRLRWPREV